MIPVKAVQLDLARQMETVPFIKAFTRKVADACYNTLVLYLEGRVRTPSFSLGEDESYSLDEMREIVACASSCGVEVVPVVSVLGHAEHFFRRPGLEAMAEERSGLCRWPVSEKQTFCLSQPEARAFLEKYVGEVATVFPGKNLHLGLDESFQFGFCDTCRERRGEMGFGPLFTEYVRWADGLCRRLDKRMWMWDDMYEFFPDELANAPKDVVMCCWIYDDDVTEWGHRGHFLNRVRVDWLARYEKLGLTAIPVGAACRHNLRTLGDYASRHRTLGFYVSQWEMTDSFYGIPMANLVGVDRAYPTLTDIQKRAVEALASKWSYFNHGYGIDLSRARHKGVLSADRQADDNERASITLAIEVLKSCASRPGQGVVPADPLSEAALLDDIVTHFEHLRFWYDFDEITPHLVSPRRTAQESQAAKARLRTLLPEMRRILARKEEQQKAWRPGVPVTKGGLAAPVRDHIAFAEKLLAQPDMAAADDWVLALSLSLPDYHGIPRWTVSGLFGDEWRVIAEGVYKPSRGNWANFERKLSFKAGTAPSALRFEEKGYGEGLLLHASVWNRERRLVPDAVTRTEGVVVDPANILKDDWRPVRFGYQDRAPIFLDPDLAKVRNVLECSLTQE